MKKIIQLVTIIALAFVSIFPATQTVKAQR